MIIRDTYNDKQVKQSIEIKVGRKFSPWERLKMRGVGSQRFTILEASDEIEELLSNDSKLNHCNIELRTRGMIMRFQSKSETYAWLLPFQFLNIYRVGSKLNIYGREHFIKCEPAHNEALDVLFLHKILKLKAQIFPDHHGL